MKKKNREKRLTMSFIRPCQAAIFEKKSACRANRAKCDLFSASLGVGLAMKGHAGTLLMQATLFFSALWFWLTVFNQTGEHLWRAVIALLLTGKLFCLMAVLLIFAPRVLYGMTAMPIELADQQLAGLLMVTVCPITYVLAAVVLISRWFQTLSDTQSNVTSTAVAAENS